MCIIESNDAWYFITQILMQLIDLELHYILLFLYEILVLDVAIAVGMTWY